MNLKNKNILLLIGFFIVLWISYQIPIRQTLKLKSDHNSLLAEYKSFADISQQLDNKQQEKSYLDSILNKYQFSTEKSFQSNLLYSISSFSESNKLGIVAFEEPHLFLKNEAKSYTYSFSVRGSYHNILMLVHELEHVNKLGNILSINFEKKKNYKTNKTHLEASILLQRLKK